MKTNNSNGNEYKIQCWIQSGHISCKSFRNDWKDECGPKCDSTEKENLNVITMMCQNFSFHPRFWNLEPVLNETTGILHITFSKCRYFNENYFDFIQILQRVQFTLSSAWIGLTWGDEKHHLSLWCPRSVTSICITRPQCINTMKFSVIFCYIWFCQNLIDIQYMPYWCNHRTRTRTRKWFISLRVHITL